MIYCKCKKCRVAFAPNGEDAAHCGVRAEVKTLKPWEVEFIYHKLPNIRTGDEAAIIRAAETVDWYHEEVVTFQAGWDACIHVVGGAVHHAINMGAV